jgi:hypothetical protein
MRKFDKTIAFAVLPIAATMAIAGCGQSAETSYETDVVDESGGELIVSDVDPDAVPVDLPETEMVNVPADEGDGESAEE